MILYRFGGDAKKIDFSYHLAPLEEGRLGLGLADPSAMRSLGLLVEGGIGSLADLYAAEMALKAFVFHDSVNILSPSCKVQIPNRNSAPFVTSLYPRHATPDSLQPILKHANSTVILGGIDQLIGFNSQEFAIEFLSHREAMRKQHDAQRARMHSEFGAPVMSIDFEFGPLEFAANSEDELFNSVLPNDPAMIGRFLRPISEAGHAAYLGGTEIRQSFEKLRIGNASQFFDPLDKSWEAHLHLLRRSLEIPVPLMISIVLSRISNRKDIPKVVIDLRDEFSAARSELWTMFEEADFRLFDTARSAKILLEIEKAAAEIVPRAMSAHDFSFPLRFDLIGRLLEFDGLGLIKDARDFASSAIWRKFSRIDAAYLVQMNLESVELRGLLSRHLTEHEIHSIAANR